MLRTASDLLVERLLEWGVDTVFGLPGDGINGIMEALRRRQDALRFVLVHHEEAAAFMACGYAKASGRLGVCLATSGPGGIHLLNGLYDAKLDHQPVLAITGMQEMNLLGTGYQQEVHLDRVFNDVAEYSVMALTPTQVPTLVDLAVRHSLGRRTVSHITFPNDVQIAPADEEPYDGPAPARAPSTAPVFMAAPGRPRDEELDRAAAVLNEGERVTMLVGAGALGARQEVLAVAEALASPIVKTLPGKAAVPDDYPLTTGGIGLLGTAASEEAMEGCDTLLMVGTNFPYTKHLPEPGVVRCVQLEADPIRAGNRIPTEVPMIGDAAEGLAALLPRLTPKSERSFLAGVQESMGKWRERMHALATITTDPIQPQHLMHVVDEVAADDAILTSDSGTIATWSARHFDIRGGREYYLSGNLATMAPGLPYAMAAQWLHPERQVIAFVGDGGFAMLMAEFDTAVRYKLPIKVVINNNASLGQILWEQMVLGFPEFGVRYEQQLDFAQWATTAGGFGVKVRSADALPGAVKRAFEHPGPALVDVDVNPNEPPMPAKVTYEQAKSFGLAFLRGQPHKASIASTLFRDKLQELRQ